MVEGGRRRRSFELALLLLSLFLCFSFASPRALPDSDLNLLEETVGNSSSDAAYLNASSLGKPKEGSFADIIDRALEKEFNESDQTEGSVSISIRESRKFRLPWKLAVKKNFTASGLIR